MTLFFAERIITAICTAERRDPNTLYFFELQTHLCYGSTLKGTYGYYAVPSSAPAWKHDGRQAARPEWRPAVCTNWVRQEFAEQIGTLENGRRVRSIPEADAAGYGPTDLHSCLAELCFRDAEAQCLLANTPRTMRRPFGAKTAAAADLYIVVDQQTSPMFVELGDCYQYGVWKKKRQPADA
jgi:hypothetical protein